MNSSQPKCREGEEEEEKEEEGERENK